MRNLITLLTAATLVIPSGAWADQCQQKIQTLANKCYQVIDQADQLIKQQDAEIKYDGNQINNLFKEKSDAIAEASQDHQRVVTQEKTTVIVAIVTAAAAILVGAYAESRIKP